MKTLPWVGISALLVVIDQLAKFWAARHGAIFRNYDFAFSLPVPEVLMYSLYAIIPVVITWYVINSYQKFTRIESFAWSLIIAGAASNIAERLVHGYVKDFIYLFSGVFNFADFYILLGIVLLFIVRGKLKHTPRPAK